MSGETTDRGRVDERRSIRNLSKPPHVTRIEGERSMLPEGLSETSAGRIQAWARAHFSSIDVGFAAEVPMR